MMRILALCLFCLVAACDKKDVDRPRAEAAMTNKAVADVDGAMAEASASQQPSRQPGTHARP